MADKLDRRKFIAAAGAMSAAPLSRGEEASAMSTDNIKTSITVEPEPLHAIPRTQYGHFIEHLGRCIKGGIWAEGESEDMFLGGVRPELVEAMKSINPALIRYPGGCFADGYHWRDGIGPRETRPRRRNRAWARLGPRIGPKEDNHFGTDEFLRLCEEVGAEPQLTANVGSGTAEEAAAWVEYCNGPEDSKWGAERARNGHPTPYNVKYWFVGNEITGFHEIGWQKPARYVQTLKEFAPAMRKVDPDIKIIASGSFMISNAREQKHKTILEGAGDVTDYLSIHLYATDPVMPSGLINYMILNKHRGRSEKTYYNIMGTLAKHEGYVARCARDVRTYSPTGKKIPLSFDEWNCWYAGLNDLVISKFNLRDALWVASCLNINHRYQEVELANIAQMVNVVGIITSTGKGTFLTPSALVYKIYTEHAGDELLPSKIDCPALPHETGLPALDVSATRSGDTVALFMVNRHLHAQASVDCELKGMEVNQNAKLVELYHDDAFRYNTYDRPEAVKIRESGKSLEVEKQGTAGRLKLILKPHSLSCYVLNVKKA
jgi:alpha-N-arabinofuranosidase